jgi:lysophospholipase L1-like esterase
MGGVREQLHDSFLGSQLEAALAFLDAHRGEVSPITLTLWGNDVGAFVARCVRDGDVDDVCVQNGALRFVRDFSDRLAVILGKLRAAAPDAEIIVSGSWDSFLDSLEFADPLFQLLNASMSQKAAAHRVRFADPFPVFNPQGNLAHEIQTMCTLTLLCTENDSHPSDAGYRVLADLVFLVSDYRRLVR